MLDSLNYQSYIAQRIIMQGGTKSFFPKSWLVVKLRMRADSKVTAKKIAAQKVICLQYSPSKG